MCLFGRNTFSADSFLYIVRLKGKILCTTQQKMDFADAMPDGLNDSDYDQLEQWYCRTGDLVSAREFASLIVGVGCSLQDLLDSA